MTRAIAVVALLLPLNTFAAAPVSFDAALGAVRSQVLKTQALQVQAKSKTSSAEINRLSSQTQRHRWDIDRLENRLRDIRRRAKNVSRDPGGNADPFLNNDLRRFIWDLRDEKRDMERTARDLERIERAAPKDPALVNAALTLESRTRWLENSAESLEREATWATFDIRRAGFTFEAMDISRETDEIEREARDIHQDARRLLNKVR
jgi:hypothetical protein